MCFSGEEVGSRLGLGIKTFLVTRTGVCRYGFALLLVK